MSKMVPMGLSKTGQRLGFFLALHAFVGQGYALAQTATLDAESVCLAPGETGQVVVLGQIDGAETFGVTILLEIVPRVGNCGTVSFTPAPPVDVAQVGDPWPGSGTFTPFDTDSLGFSATINGSVDDNGTFLPQATTYFGPLTAFPVVASMEAAGVWDLVLSTTVGESTWEGVATTVVFGVIQVGGCEAGAMQVDACVPAIAPGGRLLLLALLLISGCAILLSRGRRGGAIAGNGRRA